MEATPRLEAQPRFIIKLHVREEAYRTAYGNAGKKHAHCFHGHA